YFDETAEIVKQAATVGHTRVAVAYQDDAYGQAGLEGVTRALQPAGQKPVSLGTFKRNSVDVADAVKSIMAGQPHAIVLIGAYKSCAAMIRAAKSAGFFGSFYNVSFVGTLALATELAEAARGVIVSQVMPYPFGGASTLVGDYLASGKAAAGANFKPDY